MNLYAKGNFKREKTQFLIPRKLQFEKDDLDADSCNEMRKWKGSEKNIKGKSAVEIEKEIHFLLVMNNRQLPDTGSI